MLIEKVNVYPFLSVQATPVSSFSDELRTIPVVVQRSTTHIGSLKSFIWVYWNKPNRGPADSSADSAPKKRWSVSVYRRVRTR